MSMLNKLFIGICFTFLFACTEIDQKKESSPSGNTSASVPKSDTTLHIPKDTLVKDLTGDNTAGEPETIYPQGFLEAMVAGKPDQSQEIWINVYNAPNGQKVNKLRVYYPEEEEAGWVLLPEKVAYRNLLESKSAQYFKTGYDYGIVYLKYYAINNGHLQILAEDHDNYWIKEQDIRGYFKPVRFIEDLAKRDTWQIYGYDNYRMRKSPGLDGEIIVKLSEQKHVIKKFTKIEGNWAEALVYETKKHMDECYGDEELNAAMTGISYRGWIRIVDENGQIKDIQYYVSC